MAKKFFLIIIIILSSNQAFAQTVNANTTLKTAISIVETNVLSFGTIQHFATQPSTISMDVNGNPTVTGPDTVSGVSAGVYTLSGGSGSAIVTISTGSPRGRPKTLTLNGTNGGGSGDSLVATLALASSSITIPANGSATATVTASVSIPAAAQSDTYSATFIISASY